MNNLRYLSTYFQRIGYLLIIYFSSRLFLLLNNYKSFHNVTVLEFLEGIRFDISALVYINIPLFILLVFPINKKKNKLYRKVINITFYITNLPFIIFNNIDIEYFSFTQRRSTYDLIQLLQQGQDAKYLIPHFIFEYWYITLLTIIHSFLLFKIKYIPDKKIINGTRSILISIVIFLFGSGIGLIGARGGIQLKPILPINGGEISGSKNGSLILNTPFCILHSLNTESLTPLDYYRKEDLNKIYSFKKQPNNKQETKPNIIIIIMESFSKEFVGGYNNNKGYTPFLDSLMKFSLVLKNSYANGLKSIQALPAITSSIPTLMTNPFITSRYGENDFESLASILNQEGYKTSFFHGGRRGTMGFYGFTKKAGFSKYYGMEDFNQSESSLLDNNPRFIYDGVWGIHDEPFFLYFKDKLKKESQPFFTTFFSLSSHPPFAIPKKYKNLFPKGNLKIHESIGYSDLSLEIFFKSIQNEPWFNNTLFIITADHTHHASELDYEYQLSRYTIPMLFYKPDNSLMGERNNIVQQIDIMPSILDYIGYKKPFNSFGKSIFSSESWAISENEGTYYLFTDSGIVVNKEEEYTLFKDIRLIEEKEPNKEYIQKLKAIKQSYNIRMIQNRLKN